MSKKKNTKNTPDQRATDLSVCRVCGRRIEVTAFRNTGFCCGNCKKFYHGEKIAKRVVAPIECDTSMPAPEVDSTNVTDQV